MRLKSILSSFSQLNRMIKLITFFAVFLPIFSFGQNVEINTSGKSISDIIPINWKILDLEKGDLNQDGITDLVFAIQNTDKENIKLNDGLGTDTVDLNQRILGIYFGTKLGLYKQQLISENFIILRDSPTMEEPFEGFKIGEKGFLEINFRFWYSAGSWSMSNHKYKFQFKKDDFVLVGYDSNESNRASGETTDYSVNFLRKKIKVMKGNFSSDKTETVVRKRFILKTPFTIKSIGKPFEKDFEGIFL